jgi:protein TonB
MFTNLIESSSHAQEFKRRGSFVLFTTVTYAVLLLITGVVSIYAYDARLGQQNLELEITLLTPETLPTEPAPQPPSPAAGSNTPTHNDSPVDRFRRPTATVDTPQLPPDKVSTAPNPFPPIRNTPWIQSDGGNSYAQPTGPGGPGGGRGTGVPARVEVPIEEPPPAPTQTPAPKILRISKVINNQAISLPKPIYPPIAKQIKLQGIVNVQVLIDETGKVISAKAVSGSPLLIPEAQKAAFQARFSPAFIGEQPVKVSGVISYNFVLQ